MTEARLDELSRLYGIEPEYIDVWGKSRVVADDTKRRLLATMGVETREALALERALAARTEREWRQVLAPVQVVEESSARFQILLTLPRTPARAPASWTFTAESGERTSGELRSDLLEPIDRRELDGVVYERYTFSLPSAPGLGYHDFEIELRGAQVERHRLRLIVTPPTGHEPAVIARGARVYGPAVQLYALRSRRNWGIGDFTDLLILIEVASAIGADVVGVNPLHALFAHDPAHASPYSPSSRLLLNALYLDVEAIEEFERCAPAKNLVRAKSFQKRLKAARAAELVDYQTVAELKESVLAKLYEYFRAHHLDGQSARGRDFRAYQERMGGPLYRYALFEALQEYFHERDPKVWGWPQWPSAYRDPHAPEVTAFAETHRERIEYFQYLQWQADLQLGRVAERAGELKLAVGLYVDLALAVDRGGAEAWANQHLFAVGASVGAPPDLVNLKGQDWALPPLSPDALRARAYEPFVATMRATMRHAGALRIDHVMSLMRLFWIPLGGSAAEGAYVRYAFEELLGIVKLESRRNRCLIIGEDLGTLPPTLQGALAAAGVLSYRPLYFEKDADGVFRPPSAYPAQALVAVTTHDLPTLSGFWLGDDLAERARLGLYPAEEGRATHLRERESDRRQLLAALARERLLPEGVSDDPLREVAMTSVLSDALHRYLARAPSKIMVFQPEDVFGQRVQVNLPGTSTERPNWRLKLTVSLEDWVEDARLKGLVAAIRAERDPAQARAALRAGTPRVLPRATYRLQFNLGFKFRDATEIAPYLARLGVSHCYASPYLKARAGSSHGYNIVDHSALNPEIGSDADYAAFTAALRANGLGQVLDIVPNHMGVGGDDNHWWLDVLENGTASTYAPYFDIDWRPLKHELRGKVLLPVLGDYYGKVLESGELKLHLELDQGSFGVRYHEHCFPLDPATYPLVLGRDLARLRTRLGEQDVVLLKFQSLLTAFRNLPARHETAPERAEERRRDKEIHKRQLAELCRESAQLGEFIDENLRMYATAPGAVAAIEAMHALLEEQAYRLAYWRVAADEINYRRFFDINELAGLRMENPEVFDATHRFVLDLVRQGKIDGLRIDHPDGLHDPLQYFQRLQEAAAGDDKTKQRLYVLAEKILAVHERLPADWPIDGTTGYEFMNLANGLFVYGPAERAMTRVYHRFIGQELDFDELLYERKKLIMKVALASEMVVLANRLDQLSEPDWHTRDFTLTTLRDALIEIVACFPVYRTYVTADGASAEDRRYVDWAVAQAKKRNPATDVGVFDFIRDVLLLKGFSGQRERYRRAAGEFAQSFQQYTSPLMAKGLEDTSFYIYNRFVSLNEVGGDPRRFAVSPAAFHHANQERVRHWPHAMLATSTHDSKRSEDVRARLNVISEAAETWKSGLRRWAEINRRHKSKLTDGEPAPARNDEYLLYQTLFGAWPLEAMGGEVMSDFRERIKAYMQKAAREAKLHTSWVNPSAEYEGALAGFIDVLLANAGKNRFLADFLPFVRAHARHGLYNGLSTTALKLTAPGVPDFYQGSELWDFSLVDPDNRRPVDYARCDRALAELQARLERGDDRAALARELLEKIDDGRVKLYLIAMLLRLRAEMVELFARGSYLPLAAAGARAEHLCAYARRDGEVAVITVVARWYARLAAGEGVLPLGAEVWGDSVVELPEPLAEREYENVLTGARVRAVSDGERATLPVATLFNSLPVAVLRSIN